MTAICANEPRICVLYVCVDLCVFFVFCMYVLRVCYVLVMYIYVLFVCVCSI